MNNHKDQIVKLIGAIQPFLEKPPGGKAPPFGLQINNMRRRQGAGAKRPLGGRTTHHLRQPFEARLHGVVGLLKNKIRLDQNPGHMLDQLHNVGAALRIGSEIDQARIKTGAHFRFIGQCKHEPPNEKIC